MNDNLANEGKNIKVGPKPGPSVENVGLGESEAFSRELAPVFVRHIEPFEYFPPSPTGPEVTTFSIPLEDDEHIFVLNDETVYAIVTALEFMAQNLEHQPYFVQKQRADKYRFLAEQFDKVVSDES